ncbi:hypothetical protein MMC13_002456 [Lambiella insularis]|nr:hypothetical protein [Lambiella insularis]
MLSSLVTIALLATIAVAQIPTTNFSSSDLQTTLNEVPLGTLNAWCNSQIQICGDLCGGNTNNNTCTGSNLVYSCLCASNNSAPAQQYYANTIISNICNHAKGDCFANKAGDHSGQEACNSTYICGNATEPQAAAAGSTPTTSSASSTAGATNTASGTASASATPSATKAAAAVKIGQEYGVVILSAGLLVVMSFVL